MCNVVTCRPCSRSRRQTLILGDAARLRPSTGRLRSGLLEPSMSDNAIEAAEIISNIPMLHFATDT